MAQEKSKRMPRACEPSPIIVHTIDDVRAALQNATTPVTLQTAPDAIFYAGSLYLLLMFQSAKAEFPDTEAILILDCSDAGAEAISAMQMGHTHIRSSAAEPLRTKLRDIARQLNVIMVDDFS